MTTESAFTSKLIGELRRLLGPRAITFKHADLFTAGIPDFSTTVAGATTWFEAKRLPPERISGGRICFHGWEDIEPLQWETLARLERGYLVVYTPRLFAVTHVAGAWRSLPQGRCLWLGGVTWLQLVGQVARLARVKSGYDDNDPRL